MQVKRYNISKPEKYTVYQANNAVEKTRWHNVGTLIEFHKDDGTIGRMIEIPAIGLKANAYPMQDREPEQKSQSQQTANQPASDTGIEYPEEKIDINDIPF